MGRLAIAVALILALDVSGSFAPQPSCDPGTPVPCYQAVAEATAALPPDHAAIANVWVYNPQLHCGFCPLAMRQTALVIFFLADHTRAVVDVWMEVTRVRTAYEGSGTWR